MTRVEFSSQIGIRKFSYKTGILCLVIVALFTKGFSQEPPPIRWGKVSQEEIDLIQYDRSPDADVIILTDFGEWGSKNEQKGSLIFRRHIRYKVLQEAGIRIAEQEVRYLIEGNTESLQSLKAQTINWIDGKKQISKLALKYLPEEKINEQWARKTFKLRDVRVGSIIEIVYEIVTNNSLSPPPWYFQQEYPSLYSEVRLRGFLVDFYQPSLRGIPYPIAQEGGRWIAKHIPPLTEEPFSASKNDKRSMVRFRFQLGRSGVFFDGTNTALTDDSLTIALNWERMKEALFQDTKIEEAPPKARALKALVQSVTRNALTEEERIARIYTHVRDHLDWNGLHSTWVYRQPSEIYQLREANSGEINQLLFYLLQLDSIFVRKCFVSSKSNGKPYFQDPIIGQFDRMFCIAKTENRLLFLDATDPLRSYDLPDPEILNGIGYVLQGNKSGWIRIPYTYPIQSNYLIKFDMESPRMISGEVREIHQGYQALAVQRQLDTLSLPKFWDEHFSELRSHLSEQQSSDISLTNQQESWLEIFYPIHCDTFIEQIGDRILIDPLLSLGIQSSPFLASKRIRDIDFGYTQQLGHSVTFSLPEGYLVEKVPTNFSIKMPGGELSFVFTVEEQKDKIFIQSLFSIQNPILPAEEYPTVKEIYSRIIDAHTDRIVLKKIQ